MINDPLMEDYKPLIDTSYGYQQSMDFTPRIKGVIPNKIEQDIGIYPTVPLNFGSIYRDLRSNPFQVLIVNRGYRELTITSIEVVGDFSIVMPDNLTIQPGSIVAVPVVFEPKRAGDHTGGIYVTAGNAGGDRWLKLVGKGLPTGS